MFTFMRAYGTARDIIGNLFVMKYHGNGHEDEKYCREIISWLMIVVWSSQWVILTYLYMPHLKLKEAMKFRFALKSRIYNELPWRKRHAAFYFYVFRYCKDITLLLFLARDTGLAYEWWYMGIVPVSHYHWRPLLLCLSISSDGIIPEQWLTGRKRRARTRNRRILLHY